MKGKHFTSSIDFKKTMLNKNKGSVNKIFKIIQIIKETLSS